MATTKIRHNKHDVTWQYAKECWDALKSSRTVPPIPNYTTWETGDFSVKDKVISVKPITPMRVTAKEGSVY
jgi:hypothetical protein